MGLLRNLTHTIFSFLLLATLWITALSFLSVRGPATSVITDLGVDALNPFLISKGIGLDQAAYSKLQSIAAAAPDQSLTLGFVKAQITGADIKGLPYAQGVRLIYSRVADSYYDNGPSGTFNLPAPIASAVQTFALFPEQYDSALKATSLPTWLQPFLTYTGLAPDTLTATGHARIAALLPKFWLATLLFAGAIFLLNLLGRRHPVKSLALAAWNGSWPTIAVFAVLWLIGRLYPTHVQPVAAAFGVVAASFLPVYVVAAAVGAAAYLVSRFSSALFHAAGQAGKAAPAKVPVAARVAAQRGGYGEYDETPAYRPYAPAGQAPGRQPPAQPQPPQWSPPSRQPWEQSAQPAQPGWNEGHLPPLDPRDPRAGQAGQVGWNQPRPWDAPGPSDPRQGGQGGQGGQEDAWRGYSPAGPDDPTAPRW